MYLLSNSRNPSPAFNERNALGLHTASKMHRNSITFGRRRDEPAFLVQGVENYIFFSFASRCALCLTVLSESTSEKMTCCRNICPRAPTLTKSLSLHNSLASIRNKKRPFWRPVLWPEGQRKPFSNTQIVACNFSLSQLRRSPPSKDLRPKSKVSKGLARRHIEFKITIE